MFLYPKELTLVEIAKVLMGVHVTSFRVNRIMVMPGKDKIASAAGMRTALRLVSIQA